MGELAERLSIVLVTSHVACFAHLVSDMGSGSFHATQVPQRQPCMLQLCGLRC